MTDLSIRQNLETACLEDIGHRFRGDFFDKCGAVERWLTEILKSAGESEKPGGDRTPLGERLKKAREIAVQDRDRADKLFRHAPRVVELLKWFKPYADLRTTLAHSTQRASVSEGQRVFCYRPTADAAPWADVSLTESAQARILDDLCRLVESLKEPNARLRG
jgi:hypothetical protein